MEQHIEKLVIDHFRGLRSLELYDFGRINLLVGPNNSGKTSLLEALAVLCRPLDALEWLDTATRREASYGASRRFQTLRWLFPQAAAHDPKSLYQGHIQIAAEGVFPVQSMTATYQEVRGIPDETVLSRIKRRYANLPGGEPEIFQGAELEIEVRVKPSPSVQVTLFQDELLEQSLRKKFSFWEGDVFVTREKTSKPYLKVTTVTPTSHRGETTQARRFTDIVFKQEGDFLLDLMRIFDPAIHNIQILTPDPMTSGLFVTHQNLGVVPLSLFGDGLRRVVMIALALSSVRGGILLIDEIETAIHISVLKEVFSWLQQACNRYNVQLFATTHSLEALDALLETQAQASEGPVVFQLNSEGHPAKRFSGDLLQRLRRERGLDLRG